MTTLSHLNKPDRSPAMGGISSSLALELALLVWRITILAPYVERDRNGYRAKCRFCWAMSQEASDDILAAHEFRVEHEEACEYVLAERLFSSAIAEGPELNRLTIHELYEPTTATGRIMQKARAERLKARAQLAGDAGGQHVD